jgi:hypothetical protein
MFPSDRPSRILSAISDSRSRNGIERAVAAVDDLYNQLNTVALPYSPGSWYADDPYAGIGHDWYALLGIWDVIRPIPEAFSLRRPVVDSTPSAVNITPWIARQLGGPEAIYSSRLNADTPLYPSSPDHAQLSPWSSLSSPFERVSPVRQTDIARLLDDSPYGRANLGTRLLYILRRSPATLLLVFPDRLPAASNRASALMVIIAMSDDLRRSLIRLVGGIRSALRLALLHFRVALARRPSVLSFLLVLLAVCLRFGRRSEPDDSALRARTPMSVVRGELVLAC